MKERLKLKSWIKTALVITFIYLLFMGYLLLVSNRVEDLNNKEDNSNGSIVLVNKESK